MSKSEDKAPKDDARVVTIPVAKSEAMPQTGCVVCGSYSGTFTGAAGNARWHSECEGSRPDVIRKVRARA